MRQSEYRHASRLPHGFLHCSSYTPPTTPAAQISLCDRCCNRHFFSSVFASQVAKKGLIRNTRPLVYLFIFTCRILSAKPGPVTDTRILDLVVAGRFFPSVDPVTSLPASLSKRLSCSLRPHAGPWLPLPPLDSEETRALIHVL